MSETQTSDSSSKIMQDQIVQPNQNNLLNNQQQNQQNQNQQTYGLIYQPQGKLGQQPPIQYNQVQPIYYPQYQQQQKYIPPGQQPLLPQVIQKPQMPKIEKKPIQHDDYRRAGYAEKRIFHIHIFLSLLAQQILPLILCCSSYYNDFIEASFSLSRDKFKPMFYILLTITGIILINAHTTSKKMRQQKFTNFFAAIFTLVYGFLIQALYSSTFYRYNYYDSNNNYQYFLTNTGGDEIVIICFGFINLNILSLFAYSIQEIDKFNLKSSLGYIIVPSLTLGGILCAFYHNYGILWSITAFFIAFGIYLQFIILRIINSSKYNLRTDEGRYVSLIIYLLLFVPFFESVTTKNDEMLQESESQKRENQNTQ